MLLCRKATKTERVAQSLQRERARRLDWLAKLRSLATSLQNQAEGPARNFRLRAVLAEAKEVAGRLKELDAETRRVQGQARNLLARMARTAKSLTGAKRRHLQACMVSLRELLPRPRPASGHLAQVVVRPDDGPAELTRKANLLADSADKLERRLRRLERAVRRTERQVALQAAARRARQGGGLLGDGQRRRAVATVTPASRVRGTPDQNQEGGGTPTVGTDPTKQDTDYNTLGTNGPAASSVRHTNPGGLTQTWSSVLRAVHDLVDPSQAEALARQAASSDPAVRLAALRRALKLLADRKRAMLARARRLRAQARRLTGPRPAPQPPRPGKAARSARETQRTAGARRTH